MAKSKKTGKASGDGVLEWVRIDLMDRDESVNPGLVDERRAENIAAHFNPDIFGHPVLSLRDTGRYITIDGQNRIQALRLDGWDGKQQIECLVFKGLNRAQEAALFLGFAGKRTHHHIDRFLARITAGDKVACAISKCLQSGGYVVDRGTRDGVISATKALEDVYTGKGLKMKGHNPKALEDTILVLTAAWGRDSHSVNGSTISGVGAFFLRYNGAADPERLTKKLRSINGGAAGLFNRGKGKREMHGGTIVQGMAHYLTEEYNRGLRGKSRLPGWRDAEAS